MTAHAPVPDAEEIRDNATFDAILAALSRPGSVHRLPAPGPAPIVAALLDRECRAWADTADVEAPIRRTGASLVPSELAGYVFLSIDAPEALDRFSRLTTGDLLYPDEGAVAIIPTIIGKGPELRLTGPGIEREVRLRVGGLHPAIWTQRATLCRYPMGVEMILLDGDLIAAIPRSTTVEVT